MRAPFLFLLLAIPALAQDPALPQEQTELNSAAACLEPPPLLSLGDYNGPLRKTVAAFARKVERRSTHSPHYKPGAILCSLETGDKFRLFVDDALDPITFLAAGFNAGIDQASNRDPSFGQGATGYAKRFGADYASETTWRFFTEFAYPTVFSEDPRYYRLAHGTGGKRMLHAMEHTFVAHRDSGRRMFNVSEWLGTTSAIALNNTWHPGSDKSPGAFARQTGFAVLSDMGFDVLREFWPEIARKLHMPFREEPGDATH